MSSNELNYSGRDAGNAPVSNPPPRQFRWEEHHVMVDTLAKPPEDILAGLMANPRIVHLLHMAIGIAGEAGELLDAVKKAAIYNKPLDVENIIEEMGDLEFYMAGVRSYLRVARDSILKANVDKLNKRYAGKYSDQKAQDRADKVINATVVTCNECHTNLEQSGGAHLPNCSKNDTCLVEAEAAKVYSTAPKIPPVEFNPAKYVVFSSFDLEQLSSLGYLQMFNIMREAVNKRRVDMDRPRHNYVVVSDEFPMFYDGVKTSYMQHIAEELSKYASK
jgi:NTP pyrophosphatase (non-canonical NTP hydrolase)